MTPTGGRLLYGCRGLHIEMIVPKGSRSFSRLFSQIAAAVLTASGHTLLISSLQNSGPLAIRKFNSTEIRAAFRLLENLGLGVMLGRGVFLKSPPERVSPEVLTQFDLILEQYRFAYAKPLNKQVRAHLMKEQMRLADQHISPHRPSQFSHLRTPTSNPADFT